MIEKLKRRFMLKSSIEQELINLTIEKVNELIEVYNEVYNKTDKLKDVRAVMAQVGCVPRVEMSPEEVQSEQMFTAMFGHKPGQALKSGPNQHIVPDCIVEEIRKQLDEKDTKNLFSRGFADRRDEVEYLYKLLETIVKGDK